MRGARSLTRGRRARRRPLGQLPRTRRERQPTPSTLWESQLSRSTARPSSEAKTPRKGFSTPAAGTVSSQAGSSASA